MSKKQEPDSDQVLDGHKIGFASPEWASSVTSGFILYGKDRTHEQSAGLLGSLVTETADVVAGDLRSAERMLFTQAMTLQTAFNRYLSIAAGVMGNSEECERYTALAFRAQEQCRKTLLALDQIKSPKKPTQFIKNYVDKQVNQLKVDRPLEPVQNDSQALEATADAPVDFGSQRTTATTDSEMETLEAQHWSD